MRLCILLQPHNNNLDFFRVMAALLVIYGHAPAFQPGQTPSDFVYDILRFDYSGSLAVKFFFMLSGLLVTQSLLQRPAIKPFLIKRAARIFPGLIICLLISVFVVGLSFTSLSATAYLQHPQTWGYLLHNASLLSMQWDLPGVFENANTSIVNGSLWTLPLEAMCYLCLAVFSAVIIRHNKHLAAGLLFIPIGLTFFGSKTLPDYLLEYTDALLLGGCFCLGVFTALIKESIVIGYKGVIVTLVILLIFWFSPLQQIMFYCVFFYLCLFASGTRVFTRYLKIPGDPSYGIYIYGFIIQHLVATFLFEKSIFLNTCVSMLIAILVGFISWFLVEKPSLELIKIKMMNGAAN